MERKNSLFDVEFLIEPSYLRKQTLACVCTQYIRYINVLLLSENTLLFAFKLG